MRPRLLTLSLSLALALAGCGDDGGGNGGQPDASTGGDAGADAPSGPTVTAVDYPVIAHGGALTITGTDLAGATEVDIGGVAHTDLQNVSDTSVTVPAVDDSVPVGSAQELTVVTPQGTTPAFTLAVIHLVINEIDTDSPGSDVADFVELDTGVAEPLSLDGYVMVHFNGNSAAGDLVEIADLDAMTADTGLMVVGPATLVSPAQVVYDAGFQSGEDAVAIYQLHGAPQSFPADFETAGTDGLIDAVIYESNSDTDATELYPLLTDAVVIDEGSTSAARQTVSIQRCPDNLTRRLGASYRLEIPTPGRANVNCNGVAALDDCTIDFDATCPNVVAGDCGAIFVAHAAAVCEESGVADCVATKNGFHTNIDAPERLDIFLTGNLNSLETFMSPFMGTNATMTFFDLAGNQVGTPLTVGTDCNAGTPIANNVADLGAGAVRRIEVTGDAEVFIDNFHVNP